MVNRNNVLSAALAVAGILVGSASTAVYYKMAHNTSNSTESTLAAAGSRAFNSDQDKESYSLGVMIGQQVQATLTMGQMVIQDKSFMAGMEDTILKNELAISSDEISKNVIKLQEASAAKAKTELESKALNKQTDIFSNGNTPNIGKGEVTLVEFFDYNCPHCKALNNTMRDFVQNNTNVKVLYRPIGLVSKGSQVAATAALAAHKQNKFKEVHEALMSSDKEITEDLVMDIVKNLQLDTKQLEADMKNIAQEEATNNRKVFIELGLRGVPSVFAARLDNTNKVQGNNLIFLSGDNSVATLTETVNKLR